MNRCRIIRLSLAVALSAAALLGCLLGCPGGAWAETLTRVAAFDVNYSTSPTNPSPTQAGFAGLHDGANVNSPPAFSTTQPTSIGRPPIGTVRPVTE